MIKTFTTVFRTGQVSNATNVERGLAYDFFRFMSKPHIKRRHSQIQIALIKIGEQLGFRTWIAQNDKGSIYKDWLFEGGGILVTPAGMVKRQAYTLTYPVIVKLWTTPHLPAVPTFSSVSRTWWLYEDASGQLGGVVGGGSYGQVALLRSLAVTSDLRGHAGIVCGRVR